MSLILPRRALWGAAMACLVAPEARAQSGPRPSRFPRTWNPAFVPTWAPEIVGNHPLAPDEAYLPGLMRQGVAAATGQQFSLYTGWNSPGVAQSSIGPVMTFGGPTSSQAINVGTGFFLGGLASWTIVSLFQTTSAPGGSVGTNIYYEANPHTANPDRDLISQILSANGTTATVVSQYRNDSNILANQNGVVYTPNVLDGNWHLGTSVLTTGSANLVSYVDANVSISSPWGASNSMTDPNVYQTIGGFTANTSSNFQGSIAMVALYKRALSASQIAWLSAEPFIMLRPAVRRTYTFPRD